MTRWGRACRIALVAVLAVAALFVFAQAAGAAPAGEPGPGAASIGDPRFPQLGNGGYDVSHYTLDLAYSGPGLRRVDGVVSIRARATQALSRFDLDFTNGTVSQVTVNGAPAGWTRDQEKLVITPRQALRDREKFGVKVSYVSGPTFPLTYVWFATADGSVTAAQPNFAHWIFPCNDHPRDKASYTFHLSVPQGTTAVANGVRTGETTRAGRTEWSYEQREPMASELVQLAVGALDVTTRTGPDGLPLRDVTPRRLTAQLEPALARTRDQLAWMESKVGRYPFDTYGVLAADAVFTCCFSALEDQTLSLFSAYSFVGSDPQFYEPLMVHELSHQWFGDSVSPEVWNDVWLNEGHATWYQDEYAAYRGWENLDEVMRGIYADGDYLRASYGPVAQPGGSGLAGLYNPNVYDGGALVLYALRQLVGDPVFRRIERAWVHRYRDGTASTQDFIALASHVVGRDLSEFLDAWLYGTVTPPMPGHPDWKTNPVTPSATAAPSVASATSPSIAQIR
jgi:aminopeptidase N